MSLRVNHVVSLVGIYGAQINTSPLSHLAKFHCAGWKRGALGAAGGWRLALPSGRLRAVWVQVMFAVLLGPWGFSSYGEEKKILGRGAGCFTELVSVQGKEEAAWKEVLLSD